MPTQENDNGGPAFPGTTSQPNERGVYYPFHHQGMDLRDWFSGQALAGWLASYGPDGAVKVTSTAEFAYEMADAMLEAREKGGAK